MRTFAWEIQVRTTHDTKGVTAAISNALHVLRAAHVDIPELNEEEREVWLEDISNIVEHEAAREGNDVSVIVDITIFGEDAAPIAAMLSAGFDTVVLDEVMKVRGVTQASHSDRIPRPAS